MTDERYSDGYFKVCVDGSGRLGIGMRTCDAYAIPLSSCLEIVHWAKLVGLGTKNSKGEVDDI
jgi:hypothetical protein